MKILNLLNEQIKISEGDLVGSTSSLKDMETLIKTKLFFDPIVKEVKDNVWSVSNKKWDSLYIIELKAGRYRLLKSDKAKEIKAPVKKGSGKVTKVSKDQLEVDGGEYISLAGNFDDSLKAGEIVSFSIISDYGFISDVVRK